MSTPSTFAGVHTEIEREPNEYAVLILVLAVTWIARAVAGANGVAVSEPTAVLTAVIAESVES